MNFFQDLIPVRDQCAAIAEEFGIPSVTSLIICYRKQGVSDRYLRINPSPNIEVVSPRLVKQYGGNQSVQIEITDLHVQGISRKYQQSQLYGRGVSYVIGGTLLGQQVTGGYIADSVPGLNIPLDKGTTWELFLRRRKP